MRGFRAGAFLAVIFSISSGTFAAFSFSSGSLNANSSVTHTPSGTTQAHNPAAVGILASGASHSTSATVQGVGSANGSTFITIGSSIVIDAATNFAWQNNFVNSNATVGGTATFNESLPSQARLEFTASDARGAGSVTIKNAANTTIAELKSAGLGGGSLSQPMVISLSPGLHTINWTWSTVPFVGTGGNSIMNFRMTPGVPEPAALSLLVLPAALLSRRTRRV